jgi:cell division cycle protein 20 (cofactor of APC complex)
MNSSNNYLNNNNPTANPSAPIGDRFIPNCAAMDLEVANYSLKSSPQSPSHSSYKSTLAQSLFDDNAASTPALSSSRSVASVTPGSKILTYSVKPPAPSDAHINQQRVLYSQPRRTVAAAGPTRLAPLANARRVATDPTLTYEVPGLDDNYYLNILDWSKTNQLAVALQDSLFVMDCNTSQPRKLIDEVNLNAEKITSVHWMDGVRLAIGTNDGKMQIWDVASEKRLRTIAGHKSRVQCISSFTHLLSSGCSGDSSIITHDVRIKESHLSTLTAHSEQVCGLQWSPNGRQLASGSNDNTVMIWDASACISDGGRPRYRLTEHIAAVKALAWCPWQNDVLATGGGLADRTLRVWNTLTGQCTRSVDTGSQICSLAWSKTHRELVTGHGFGLNVQTDMRNNGGSIILWDYQHLQPVAELVKHEQRVLHLAVSPSGDTLCSASADQTLRLWNMWPSRPNEGVPETAAVTKSATTPSVPFTSLASASRVRRSIR